MSDLLILREKRVGGQGGDDRWRESVTVRLVWMLSVHFKPSSLCFIKDLFHTFLFTFYKANKQPARQV